MRLEGTAVVRRFGKIPANPEGWPAWVIIVVVAVVLPIWLRYVCWMLQGYVEFFAPVVR